MPSPATILSHHRAPWALALALVLGLATLGGHASAADTSQHDQAKAWYKLAMDAYQEGRWADEIRPYTLNRLVF